MTTLPHVLFIERTIPILPYFLDLVVVVGKNIGFLFGFVIVVVKGCLPQTNLSTMVHVVTFVIIQG